MHYLSIFSWKLGRIYFETYELIFRSYHRCSDVKSRLLIDEKSIMMMFGRNISYFHNFSLDFMSNYCASCCLCFHFSFYCFSRQIESVLFTFQTAPTPCSHTRAHTHTHTHKIKSLFVCKTENTIKIYEKSSHPLRKGLGS